MAMPMAQGGRFGVDPVTRSDSVDPPFCPHGPTLLFKRFYADKEAKEFYACAVHRDRKGCSFFKWADDRVPADKCKRWKDAFLEQQSKNNLHLDVAAVRSLSSCERCYCPACGLLLVKKDLPSHDGHGVIQNVSDSQLEEPTTLLCPVDDRKSQAQYLFSDASLYFLRDELRRLQYTKVLCVGTPRLHELLVKEGEIRSLLLDVDRRYVQFYTSEQYQQYSMFNHFFYSLEGLSICQQFLSDEAASGTTAVVLDPPFGGRAELLADSVKKYWRMAGKEFPTFLVFPYFLESHVAAALPSLWMMDYQVTYLNHKHFGAAQKKPNKPKPSPVRIFTNLSRPGFRLPTSEGYRLCKSCVRYVSRHNCHCSKCDSCTSKDGKPYVHCDSCEKCVKKSWVHCEVCDKCDQPQHLCGDRVKVGCHVCGSMKHKRKDCTERTIDEEQLPPRKKRMKNTS